MINKLTLLLLWQISMRRIFCMIDTCVFPLGPERTEYLQRMLHAAYRLLQVDHAQRALQQWQELGLHQPEPSVWRISTTATSVDGQRRRWNLRVIRYDIFSLNLDSAVALSRYRLNCWWLGGCVGQCTIGASAAAYAGKTRLRVQA